MRLGHRLLWMAENVLADGFAPPDFNRYVRTIPLRRADFAATGQRSDMYQKALDHPTYDAFWRSLSTRTRLDHIHVPVFSVGGWYDSFVESDLNAFAALQHNSGVNRIVIGPWPHNMSIKFHGVDFGKDSGAPIRRLQITSTSKGEGKSVTAAREREDREEPAREGARHNLGVPSMLDSSEVKVFCPT